MNIFGSRAMCTCGPYSHHSYSAVSISGFSPFIVSIRQSHSTKTALLMRVINEPQAQSYFAIPHMHIHQHLFSATAHRNRFIHIEVKHTTQRWQIRLFSMACVWVQRYITVDRARKKSPVLFLSFSLSRCSSSYLPAIRSLSSHFLHYNFSAIAV